MKVVFLLRRDALQKPGGDTSKVRRYCERLEELGIETQTVTDRALLRGLSPDVVHLVNLDLPAENLANAAAARRTGAKTVLSTIRHPYGGVLDFFRRGDDRLYSKLRSVGVRPPVGIGIRELVKLGRARDAGFWHSVGHYERLQQRLIDRVDHLFVMAPGEWQAITTDFVVDCGVTNVENALSFTPEVQGETPRVDYAMVSIGRIEPRKNSLALARMAASSPGTRVAFAGQLNNRHPGYAREFMRLVEEAPNIDYHGQLPHDAVRTLLRRSASYVNAAWFEVVSQADFEAAACGVPIATTTQSYLADFLGGGAWIEPGSVYDASQDSTGGSLEALIGEARPAQISVESRTWSMAGDELAAAYAGLR